jgi:hypothetical protein
VCHDASIIESRRGRELAAAFFLTHRQSMTSIRQQSRHADLAGWHRMDIGLIDERVWAVVEFNPAWCSGVHGAESKRILVV